MHQFQELSTALPKCFICTPNEAGLSEIQDRDGNRIGHIHWQIPQVSIYEEYEYFDEVVEAIGRDRFNWENGLQTINEARASEDPPIPELEPADVFENDQAAPF